MVPGGKPRNRSVLHSSAKHHTPVHNAVILSDCSAPAYYTHTQTQSENNGHLVSLICVYMGAHYLVFPQMQDFVINAGHCGQGPGWHKLQTINKHQ